MTATESAIAVATPGAGKGDALTGALECPNGAAVSLASRRETAKPLGAPFRITSAVPAARITTAAAAARAGVRRNTRQTDRWRCAVRVPAPNAGDCGATPDGTSSSAPRIRD